MDRNVKMGFPPVFDSGSKVLILGSFPSVKSREISFYYGNKQNRFWKTIFSIFNQPFLESTQERIGFLKEKGIALWDVVESCEIVGSADSSIKKRYACALRENCISCKDRKSAFKRLACL